MDIFHHYLYKKKQESPDVHKALDDAIETLKYIQQTKDVSVATSAIETLSQVKAQVSFSASEESSKQTVVCDETQCYTIRFNKDVTGC